MSSKSRARQLAQEAHPDPQPCECCGSSSAMRYHDDHSKPLEIRWLCPRCHTKLHWDKRTVKDKDGNPEKKVRGVEMYPADMPRLELVKVRLAGQWVERGRVGSPARADVIRYLLDVYDGKEARGSAA